jgi:hypothetical protein
MVAYVSIWNLYNRKNVAMLYWNENDNQPKEALQWSFLPVIGLEYEF